MLSHLHGEKGRDANFLTLMIAILHNSVQDQVLIATGKETPLENAALICTLAPATLSNITPTQYAQIKIINLKISTPN